MWSTSSGGDGEDVEKGGAANLVPNSSSRVVYTYMGTLNKDLTHSDNRVQSTNGLITDAVLLTGGAGDPTRDQVIDFINGKDLPDTDQDNDVAEARTQLGDPLHSQPVSMVYGPGLRDGLIFSATNDGMLHAFNLETGREEWAFIPSDFLDDQIQLYTDDPAASKHYGIDGDLALQVVADNDATIETGEKVYLFFGMRRGGDFYYGLDVSDRSAPKLLWRIDGTTLPPVLRNNQVARTERARALTKKAGRASPFCGVPEMKKAGRCQTNQTRPRIRLAGSGRRCVSKRGSA